jgi:hypothetical protein
MSADTGEFYPFSRRLAGPQIGVGRRGERRRVLDGSRTWLADCWVRSLLTTLRSLVAELPQLRRDEDRRTFVFVDVKACGNFASSVPPVFTLSISFIIPFPPRYTSCHSRTTFLCFSPYILPWIISVLKIEASCSFDTLLISTRLRVALTVMQSASRLFWMLLFLSTWLGCTTKEPKFTSFLQQ